MLSLLLFAGDLWLLVATGVLFQLGGAIVEPTLYAIVIDRTPPERRGQVLMVTFIHHPVQNFNFVPVKFLEFLFVKMKVMERFMFRNVLCLLLMVLKSKKRPFATESRTS